MDYLSDSDIENSLPPLSETAIDVDLLRDWYSLVSNETRERLRQETASNFLLRIFDLGRGEAKTTPLDPVSRSSGTSSGLTALRSDSSSDLRGLRSDLSSGLTGSSTGLMGLSSGSSSGPVTTTNVNNFGSTYVDENVPGLLFGHQTGPSIDLDGPNGPNIPIIHSMSSQLQTSGLEVEDTSLQGNTSLPGNTSLIRDTSLSRDTSLQENTSSPEESVPADSVPSISQQDSLLNQPNIPIVTLLPPPPTDQSNNNSFIRPSRSLRRRNFASMHPYIADQADYLEICSIGSMNEMFDAEMDLNSVARTLNHLYMRKKKIYPDEDRYRAPNFFVHLKKNRLLAQNADADSAALNLITSSQATDELGTNESPIVVEPAGEQDHGREAPASQNGDSFNSEFPHSPGILSDLDPSSVSSDDDIPSSMQRNDRSQSLSPGSVHESSTDSLSESEQEQLIKIGGKYRKLSRLFRGVLPESAKRLAMFQKEAPVKKRKPKHREITPRKGLAQRKLGKLSAQSVQLEQELRNVEYSDDDDQELRKQKLQSYFDADESASLQQSSKSPLKGNASPDFLDYVRVSSSSEDDSEDDMGVSSFYVDLPIHEPHFDDPGSEADEESIFPDVSETKRKSRLSSSSPGSTRSNKPPTTRTKGPKRKKLANLKKRRFHQTIFPVEKRHRVSSKPISIANRKSTDSPTTTVAPKKAEKPKRIPKSAQLPGMFTNTDYKRDPNSSTFVYEIESANKFVKQGRSFASKPQFSIPTRDILFGDNGVEMMNQLICDCDFSKLVSLSGSHDYFPGLDGVSFTFMKHPYTLSLICLRDSRETLNELFSILHSLLNRAETFLNLFVRQEVVKMLPSLMKWLLISRERPNEALKSEIYRTLALFSKFQTREVRRFQAPIQSQFLVIYWILMNLELSYAPSSASLHKDRLEKFALDFWIQFLLSFLLDDLKETTVYDSVMVLRMIFRDDSNGWWKSIVDSIPGCFFQDRANDLMDMIFFIASQVPATEYSWAPFLAILNVIKKDKYSDSHHHYISICEAVINRLGWPFEERVLVSIYSSLALRRFSNFADEERTPDIITGVIRSESDFQISTVFDRFLLLIYRFVSSLETNRDVKRLISKLLPSSAFSYLRNHQTRTIFVNRANLLLLLSQISSIDLGGQLKNMVDAVTDSNDTKIYYRAVEVVETSIEISIVKSSPMPIDSVVSCLKMSAIELANSLSTRTLRRFHSPFNRVLKLIGVITEHSKSSLSNIDSLFEIFGQFNIASAPDADRIKVIGLVLIALHEAQNLKFSPRTIDFISEFQKNLIASLSSQMSRVTSDLQPQSRELIEMHIQLWNTTAKVLGNRHWNVMMFQKFSFMGNDQARSQFLCYFCLEFLHDNDAYARTDDILSIDKIFIRLFVSPSLAGYILDLFNVLIKEPKSVFCSARSRSFRIQSLYSLTSNRFQILSELVRNIISGPRIPAPERVGLLTDLVESLHDQYNKHYQFSDYVELCKQLMDIIRSNGQILVKDINVYWDLAAKLGLANRQMQMTWFKLTIQEKLSVFHGELSCSLLFDLDPFKRMEPWVSGTETIVLCGLLEVYANDLGSERGLWCPVHYILTIILERLRGFQIALQNGVFFKLVKVLLNIAKASTNTSIFETRCMLQVAKMVEFGILSYDGYKEQNSLKLLAKDLFASIDSVSSPEYTNVFTSLKLEQLISTDAQNVNSSKIPTPQQIFEALEDTQPEVTQKDLMDVEFIRLRIWPRKIHVSYLDLSFF